MFILKLKLNGVIMFYKFYKIKEVKPKPDMKLLIQFENGIFKIYNVKQLLEKFKNFEALEDEILFNLVKIDAHGYGVYWNDYLDISCNELWHNGKEVDLKNIK